MKSGKKELLTIKGIKMGTINTVIIVIVFILCLFFAAETWSIKEEYENTSRAADISIECRRNAQLVKDGSYYLTQQVQLFVTTGKKEYADNYFKEADVTKRRDRAIENLRNRDIRAETYNSLLAALSQSNNLMNREIYAIRLVAEANGDDISGYNERVERCVISDEDMALSAKGKRDLAYELIFGPEYMEYRVDIDTKIQSFIDDTYNDVGEIRNASIQKLKRGVISQCVFIALIFLINILFHFLVNKLILKPIKIYVKCIKEGKAIEEVGAREFNNLALTYNNVFEVNHKNEKILRFEAEHDHMTGLLNKRSFNRISKQYRAKKIPLALIIIDIDDFKAVNDTYGHSVGDEVIKNVGNLLTRSFRPTDIVARIGGDEFAVIMLNITSLSAESIEMKMSSINNTLKKTVDDLPNVSLSAGGAFSKKGYSDRLFEIADKALYNTKKNGKCGCTMNDVLS